MDCNELRKRASEDPDNIEVLLELGRCLVSNNGQGAAEIFRKAISLDETRSDGWRGLGVALQEQDPEESLRAFRRAYEVEPAYEPNITNLILFLGKRAETIDEAITLGEHLVARFPSAPNYCLLGALFANKPGRRTVAIQHLKKSFEMDDGYVATLDNLGALLSSEEDAWRDAEFYLRKAIDIADSGWTWFLLAELRSKYPENTSSAIATYREAISRGIEFPACLAGIGSELVKAKEYEEAEHFLRRAVKANSSYLKAWSSLAELYAINNAPKNAEHCYRVLTTLDADNAEFWYKLGYWISVQSGRASEAEQAFRSVTALKVNNINGWVGLTQTISLHQSRIDEAHDEWVKAISFNQASGDFWFGYATWMRDHHYDNEVVERAFRKTIELAPAVSSYHAAYATFLDDHLNDHAGAERYYKKAFEFDHTNSFAWFNYGTMLSKHLGRNQEAVECYRNAVEYSPEFERAWYGLGIALEKLGRLEEAEAAFRSVLELDENQLDALYRLATLVGRDFSRPKEAEALNRKLIELGCDHTAVAWRNVGLVIDRTSDRLQDAIDAFRKSVETDNNYAPGWLSLALALQKQDVPEEEINTAFQNAILADADLPSLWRGYATFLFKQRQSDNDAVERALLKAIEQNTGDSVAWCDLGALYNRMDNERRAIECLEKSLELRPNSAIALYNLGVAHSKLSEFRAAEKWLRAAIDIEPDFAEAWQALGRTFQDENRNEEAEKAYKHVLTLDPNHKNGLKNYISLLKDDVDRREETEDLYKRVLKVDPLDHEQWTNYGAFLMINRNRHGEAKDAFETALSLKEEAIIYMDYGVLYTLEPTRDLKRAEELLHKSIGLDAQRAMAHINLGLVFGMQGKVNEAIRSLLEGIRLKPTEVHGRWYIAVLYIINRRNLRRADIILRKLSSSYPDLGAIWFAMGLLRRVLHPGTEGDPSQYFQRGVVLFKQEDLELLISISPNITSSLEAINMPLLCENIRALLLSNCGRTELQLESLAKAHELIKRFESHALIQAIIYIVAGDSARAHAILKANPQESNAIWQYYIYVAAQHCFEEDEALMRARSFILADDSNLSEEHKYYKALLLLACSELDPTERSSRLDSALGLVDNSSLFAGKLLKVIILFRMGTYTSYLDSMNAFIVDEHIQKTSLIALNPILLTDNDEDNLKNILAYCHFDELEPYWNDLVSGSFRDVNSLLFSDMKKGGDEGKNDVEVITHGLDATLGHVFDKYFNTSPWEIWKLEPVEGGFSIETSDWPSLEKRVKRLIADHRLEDIFDNESRAKAVKRNVVTRLHARDGIKKSSQLQQAFEICYYYRSTKVFTFLEFQAIRVYFVCCYFRNRPRLAAERGIDVVKRLLFLDDICGRLFEVSEVIFPDGQEQITDRIASFISTLDIDLLTRMTYTDVETKVKALYYDDARSREEGN